VELHSDLKVSKTADRETRNPQKTN
jgi:hypothetical protein